MAKLIRLPSVTPVVALCLAAPLHAQSSIALQPLVPISNGQLIPPAAEPPRLPKPDQQITLDKIPRASEATDKKNELAIKDPRDQIPTQSMADFRVRNQTMMGGVKTVDQMIRQPIDHFQNFTRVLAQEDNAPLQQSPSIRGQLYDPTASYDWSPTGYCWQSPAFCYSPLYFEQPNLERYGTGPGHYVAPIASAGYFYAQVAALPILVWRKPCCLSKECTLGNHRPGDCTPHQYRYVERNATPHRLLAQNVHGNVPQVSMAESATPGPNTADQPTIPWVNPLASPPNTVPSPTHAQLAVAQIDHMPASNGPISMQTVMPNSIRPDESLLPPPVAIQPVVGQPFTKPAIPEVRKISAP